MASQMHKTLTALLTSAVLTLCAATAPAQEPIPQIPIVFWGIQRGNVHDSAIEASVKERLQQMGEVVLPRPKFSGADTCSGAACGLALRDSSDVKTAHVVGGQIEPAANGDWQGKLWWVDVASGKTVSRVWQCHGCNLPSLLAREAAQLTSAAPTAPADSANECAPSIPEVASPVSSGPSEPLRTALDHGVRVSLAASGGARVSVQALTKDVQKALLQMGVHVANDQPANAAAAESEATLGIDLAGQPTAQPGAVELITLTLQAQGRERRVRFYCPRETCQPRVSRSLRLNLGVLFNSGEVPVVATVIRDNPRCTPAVPPGPRIAGIQDMTPLPQGEGNPAPPAAPAVEDKPTQTAGDKAVKCPKSDRQRNLRIAGGVFLGAGLLGLIPSGIAASRNGTEDGTTGVYRGQPVPNVLDTTAAYGAGLALSGVGIITGVTLFSISARNPAEVAPCAAH